MTTKSQIHKLHYYTAGTANGMKGAIALEELGLSYEQHNINLSTGEQKERWFTEINPNGRIPALVAGDLKIFESAAILLYLTTTYDKDKRFTFDVGTTQYYEMLSWLTLQVSGIGPMFGAFVFVVGMLNCQAIHFRLMAPIYSAYGIKRYIDETKRLLSVLEIRLSKAQWLAGDKYTIADMASYPWVNGAPPVLGIDTEAWPGVTKWLKRIAERPAVAAMRRREPYDAMHSVDFSLRMQNLRTEMDARMGKGNWVYTA